MREEYTDVYGRKHAMSYDDIDWNDLGIPELYEDPFGDTSREEHVSYPRRANTERKEKVARKKAEKMELYDWMQCIVIALVLGILIFVFVGRVVGIAGNSMYPTLHNLDKVITTNVFYTPEQGDIVVFQTDSYGEESLVKRVIAVGGQTVDINFDTGIVYVDDVPLDEAYTAELTYSREDFTGPVTVPEGYLFVMGDNRNASTDSRSSLVGLVSEDWIIGKVHFIILPGGTEDSPMDFSRIGSVYK